MFTEAGLREAEAAFRQVFETDDQTAYDADVIAAVSPDAHRR